MLIPKTKDLLYLKDYRPINLICCMYKIVSKILALCLRQVVEKLASMEQSACIEGISILNDPLIINEFVTWAEKAKKKVLCFKVDFDKVFDLLN